MILKQKDDISSQVQSLEALLSRRDLSKFQRDDIENQLWMLQAGARGEKEAAYHIDFRYKNGQSAVIHDLRIEHAGRVAQIDHLIVTRFLDVHVVESKAFGGEIRVSADGEWEAKTRHGWHGMPSPVEQNRRHIEVLESFIRDRGLAPKRLGMSLPIHFHNWVLVAPTCRLQRSGNSWDNVVKMDMFEKRLLEQIDKLGPVAVFSTAAKVVSAETVTALARELIASHRPTAFDYPARFGIREHTQGTPEEPTPASTQKNCQGCGAALEPKVVAFCRYNSRRFGKRLLCRDCQTKAIIA